MQRVTMVRYTTKPGHAAENEALSRAVFAQLRSVSPEGALFIEMLHREAGVALHFGMIVDAITDAPSGGQCVTCRGGAQFHGDMVIAIQERLC